MKNGETRNLFWPIQLPAHSYHTDNFCGASTGLLLFYSGTGRVKKMLGSPCKMTPKQNATQSTLGDDLWLPVDVQSSFYIVVNFIKVQADILVALHHC